MKKTNYKTDQVTMDEFINDLGYLLFKYSGTKFAKLFGLEPKTLRYRVKKKKGEK